MNNDAAAIQKLFETVSLGAPEHSISFVLWRVTHRLQRHADRALEPFGLTHLQFMTLIMAAWLGRGGEPISQAAIARQGAIHPMQVSLMLKTLEEKGMVTRQRDPSDVRAKLVFVTETGLNALRQALPPIIEVQRRLFGDTARPGRRLLDTLLALERKAPRFD